MLFQPIGKHYAIGTDLPSLFLCGILSMEATAGSLKNAKYPLVFRRNCGTKKETTGASQIDRLLDI